MKNTRKIRRQQIKETVARVSPWELSGSSESIYANLLDTENYYRKKDDTIINIHWEWECSPYSDAGEFALIVTRLENDKEYNTRVNKLMKIKEGERVAKEKEQKNEYEEYLRLKQKFDKENWNPTPKADYSDF